MSEHGHAEPLQKKLLTPGVIILLILMANGAFFLARRFLGGLGAVTHLDQQHPWGIWIAIDVASGVALAAGGFTTAALVEIFHRDRYHPLLRPALLTAMLGYTFVGLGVMVDLGRWYNIWHPLVPSMWSGHSALFEVGMCVTTYVTVLYIEFVPVLLERFKNRVALPGALSHLNGLAEWILKLLDNTLMRVMFIFTILGVVLSCMHQSSLGALMVLVPSKIHSLWWTPALPVLFLLSAFAVGYPMVIMESMIAARSFGRKPEMSLLSPLSRITIFLLGLYAIAKITDLAVREQFHILFNGSLKSNICILEILIGIAIPFTMLMFRRVRNTPSLLFTAALLIVAGVILNRVNLYLVAFSPPYAQKTYWPSFGEISVTVGMIATLMFLYRVFVTIFPVLPQPHHREMTHA